MYFEHTQQFKFRTYRSKQHTEVWFTVHVKIMFVFKPKLIPTEGCRVDGTVGLVGPDDPEDY